MTLASSYHLYSSERACLGIIPVRPQTSTAHLQPRFRYFPLTSVVRILLTIVIIWWLSWLSWQLIIVVIHYFHTSLVSRKRWLAIAKLKPLSLFISLLLMLKKALGGNVKGLASYCKAETTFTFHFSILTLSNAFLSIINREMKV